MQRMKRAHTHSSSETDDGKGKRLLIALALNLGINAAELIGGVVSGEPCPTRGRRPQFLRRRISVRFLHRLAHLAPPRELYEAVTRLLNPDPAELAGNVRCRAQPPVAAYHSAECVRKPGGGGAACARHDPGPRYRPRGRDARRFHPAGSVQRPSPARLP